MKSPRPIDGPIPFEIAGTVPVEDWTGRKGNIAAVNIARGTPIIMRNTVVSKWPALKKWSPEYFRNEVPVWKNISRAKALRRCFINFEPNTPFEKVTPWDFWENRESREEYPMSMSEWFSRASNTTDDVKWFFAEEVPQVSSRVSCFLLVLLFSPTRTTTGSFEGPESAASAQASQSNVGVF